MSTFTSKHKLIIMATTVLYATFMYLICLYEYVFYFEFDTETILL